MEFTQSEEEHFLKKLTELTVANLANEQFKPDHTQSMDYVSMEKIIKLQLHENYAQIYQ